jgi:ATP-dependent DNA helicase RecG
MLRFVHFYPASEAAGRGRALRIFGELRDGFFGAEMIHPRKAGGAGEPLPESLTPIYPTTAGLAQSALRKLIAGALRHNGVRDELPEPCAAPQPARAARGAALLHAPPPSVVALDIEDRGHPAWQRIKLDELLAQQISLRRAYAARRAKNAAGLPLHDTLTRACWSSCPSR